MSEVALRMSIDEVSPHPTAEVIVAIVRRYGIDPTWLLTGEYDAATHRHAMEHGTAEALAQLARKHIGRHARHGGLRLMDDAEDVVR